MDKSTVSCDNKTTLRASLKSFFSRLFRRSGTSVDLGVPSGIEQLSCVTCTRAGCPKELPPGVDSPEPIAAFAHNPWESIRPIPQPRALHPTYVSEYLLKQIASEGWLTGMEIQNELHYSQSFGRLLQCPFCFHVASESDYRPAITETALNTRFVPSHSIQTFCELDEPDGGTFECTNLIKPVYGSLMTDSGISIESDKVSAARPRSTTSALFTPSPQETLACFQLSTEPPPSPAPQPVPLVPILTDNKVAQRKREYEVKEPHKIEVKEEEKGEKGEKVEKQHWSKLSRYSESPSLDALQMNAMGLSNACCNSFNESVYDDRASAFITSSSGQSVSSELNGIDVNDVFSCTAIRDALESEKRTQLIQSRTQEQIKSLLQFTLGSNAKGGSDWKKDVRVELRKELSILEDAKNVINRQIEEIKKHYSQIMLGKLSLPLVERVSYYSDSYELQESNEPPDFSTFDLEKKSYSLDDLRFREFGNPLFD